MCVISIAINVKNGEKYLARCLNALIRFEDVVLLDNYSTDKTLEIARSYANVRIFEHEFCGMGKVRNMVAGFAKHDWVLFVDCDEVVSQQLVDVLLNTQFENGCIYRILRHNFYANFRVSTSSWGNDWILRLYNRQQTRFIENEVHDSFVPNGLSEKKLQGGYIYHFPYDEVSKLIDKMQFYSGLYAKQHFGKKKPKLYSIPFRAFMMFFKCYILKRGFLQGFEGLAISSYNAMGVFSKYIKLYELGYKRNIAIAFSVNVSVKYNSSRQDRQDRHNDFLPLLAEVHEQIILINQQNLLPSQVLVILVHNNDTLVEDTEDSNNSDRVNNNSDIADRIMINVDEFKTKLAELLQRNLVMPGTVVVSGGGSKGISELILRYFEQNPEVQDMVYMTDTKLLNKVDFVKQCKTAILRNKTVGNTIVYSPSKGSI